MSWSIFKQEMVSKMENSSFKSTDEFADFFTQKYDQCMKRGLDLVTGNTVIKGNTELMRSTVLYALEVGKNSKTETFYNQSIALLGKGAVMYWTGAELGKIPPAIPAPGTILNLSVISNTVTNPGVWPEAPIPVIPTKSNNPYLDAFIIQSTIHLTTISGFCNTISQYPPIAPPGPAFLPFTGFNIPPSKGQENFLEQIEQELEEGQDPIVQDDTPRVESKELDDFEKASNKKINKGSVIKRKVEVDAGSFNPAQSNEQIVSNDASDDNQPPPKIYGKIGGFAPPRPPNLSGKNGFLDIGQLVAIERGCSRYGGNYLLHPQAAEQYFKLKEVARKNGFNWTISSAYRSVDHQLSLKSAAANNAEKLKTIATPGSSPHGWAIAIDFGELNRQVGGSGNPAVNRTGRETSKLYRFLSNVAPQFGWYNPYRLADGIRTDEIWHWEYWGFYT
jgi:LAS superfamily LD-carboxypeptidase LdcB